jgi:hypothetical protein
MAAAPKWPCRPEASKYTTTSELDRITSARPSASSLSSSISILENVSRLYVGSGVGSIILI